MLHFPYILERARLASFLDFSIAKRNWADARRDEMNEETIRDLWKQVKLTRSRWTRIYTYQMDRDGR